MRENKMKENKMDYEEFKEALKETLQGYFGGKAEISFSIVPKINNIRKESIAIREKGKGVSPAVHLDALYGVYAETEDFDKCVEEVLKICKEQVPVSQNDVQMTFGAVKDRLRMRLVKKEWNGEMLERVPHREYLDFAVVFYVHVNEDRGMTASFLVTNEIADNWGAGQDELWEAAFGNLGRELFSIMDMGSILCDDPEEGLQDEEDETGLYKMLYVMTNSSRSYGARAVLRKDMIRELADEKDRNFYLLPSSVHEWILCEDNGKINKSYLKKTVQAVNGDIDKIRPEECLSDSIYYYDRKQDEVRIVA